jgi:hypothetical protein
MDPAHYALVNTPRGTVMIPMGRIRILEPYVEVEPTTKPPVLDIDEEPEEISEAIKILLITC